jgi:hypothetical protein
MIIDLLDSSVRSFTAAYDGRLPSGSIQETDRIVSPMLPDAAATEPIERTTVSVSAL